MVADSSKSSHLTCSWGATSSDAVCQSPVSIQVQNASVYWSNRKKTVDSNSHKVKVLAVPCPIVRKCPNWKFDHQKFCPSLLPSRVVLQGAVHWQRGKQGEVVHSNWHHTTTSTTSFITTTITTSTKSLSLLKTYLSADFTLQTNFTHKIHSPSLSAHQSQA